MIDLQHIDVLPLLFFQYAFYDNAFAADRFKALDVRACRVDGASRAVSHVGRELTQAPIT